MRAVGLVALVAAGVLGGGYLLQTVALPAPGQGNIAAAHALSWLKRYRSTSGEILVDGRWRNVSCYHGWIDGPRGHDRRGTLLELGRSRTIRDIPPHTLLAEGVPHPVSLLQAAGCTQVLANRLATLSEFVGGVRAKPVHISGASAFAVHFPHLTLYVVARTGRPLGVNEPRARGIFRLVSTAPPGNRS